MGVANQLRNINNHFGVVKAFPEYAKTPIVIGESDPEGLRGLRRHALPLERLSQRDDVLELHGGADRADLRAGRPARGEPDRRGLWAFLFEDQPYFDGFRDLATNGIDKPVLNVFRMLGQMRGNRVQTESSAGLTLEECATRACAAPRTSMRSRASRRARPRS